MVEFYDSDLREFKKQIDDPYKPWDESKADIVRGKLLLLAMRKLIEVEEIYGYMKSSAYLKLQNMNFFEYLIHAETNLSNTANELGVNLYDPRYEMDTHPIAVHYGSGIPFYDDLSDIKQHDQWRETMKRGKPQIYMVKIKDLVGTQDEKEKVV